MTHERSLATRFARSTPTQATAVEQTTVDLLCVRDGHTGAAPTNRLDDDGLRAAAQRARARDDRGGAQRRRRVPGPARPGRRVTPARASTPRPPRSTRRRRPARCAPPSRRAPPPASRRSGSGPPARCARRSHRAAGIALTEAVTDAHLKVIARDDRGRSGFASATAVASGEIDAGAVVSAAIERRASREPLELAPGAYPVVLDHAAVATLLEFLAELAFNGLPHAEGRGALDGSHRRAGVRPGHHDPRRAAGIAGPSRARSTPRACRSGRSR